jgi:hypothetical protein
MVAMGGSGQATATDRSGGCVGCDADRMADGSGRTPGSGWAAMRPVLVGCLLLVDAFAVASLAIVHPHGWLPPFIAFGSLLIGLILFEAWAIQHRRDDA